MHSKKFDTEKEAEDYMYNAGKVKYYGREGNYYIYTLTIGSVVYQIKIYDDGLLEVFNVRYE